MKTTFKTALTLAALFAVTTSATAQVNSRFATQIQNGTSDQNAVQVAPDFEAAPGQVQVAPEFAPPAAYIAPEVFEPPTCNFIPKLQFDGRELHGVGMQVVHTDHGGVAERVGLEAGDIIVQIDGQPIHCATDYTSALDRAARYNGGHVDLLVRNVRWVPGCNLHKKYVSLHADLPKICLVPAVASR